MSKPWYNLIQPREDLRSGQSLEAADFAVNLGQILTHNANETYQNPEQFFVRTYLTKNLSKLAIEVNRRLAGEMTGTSAVFNIMNQFGGGKTHALTMLYHLAKHGKQAHDWEGVNKIRAQAQISEIPQANIAVFVGTDFDTIKGRGGNDNTPHRLTPWGEIAFQLGGEANFNKVAEHDVQHIAPAGDVIHQMLPTDRPCLILMDELMNYVSRGGDHAFTQLYSFLQNLSEEIRSTTRAVLAISLPASELEMTPESQANYQRLEKLLARLSKAMLMSTEKETSEIIRRRLFDWEMGLFTQEGKVLLPKEVGPICQEYAQWTMDNKSQLGVDHFDQTQFLATYPFHPTVLSVFERKWQTLPRFQRTRGILRLLALWVAHAFQQGMAGRHKEKLITLGTAPLEESLFRAELFKQLGEERLEAVITTDIIGNDAFALRLDRESHDDLKKVKLHQKVATTILFESSGGIIRKQASLPEIRLAVGQPKLDIGNIETVLDALLNQCYYLSSERNHYHFSTQPNLNKLHADRSATVKNANIQEHLYHQVRDVLKCIPSVDCCFFPQKSDDIANRPKLTFVILAPEQVWQDNQTQLTIDKFTKQCGSSYRVYQSALIWIVADSSLNLHEDTRKLLGWQMIDDEKQELQLEKNQLAELKTHFNKAKSLLRDNVCRAYRHIILPKANNQIEPINLGLIQPSNKTPFLTLILQELISQDKVTKSIQPRFFIRNWSPVSTEWPTKSVRDIFFRSPEYPRLLNAEPVIKTAIVEGVKTKLLAYVGKGEQAGEYQPFYYGEQLNLEDIEISDDWFIIKAEEAENYVKKQTASEKKPITLSPTSTPLSYSLSEPSPKPAYKPKQVEAKKQIRWQGQIPARHWMNFYKKIISKQVTTRQVTLTLQLDIHAKNGISEQTIVELQEALKELGLDDQIE